MCEKRTRTIKKVGTPAARLREARRLQRLQRATPPPANANPTPPCPQVDKTVQSRVILALAWKTMALMYKNRLIQQKIIDLQKETAEFVRTVMTNPENKKRFLQNLRQHGSQPPQPMTVEPNNNVANVTPSV